MNAFSLKVNTRWLLLPISLVLVWLFIPEIAHAQEAGGVGAWLFGKALDLVGLGTGLAFIAQAALMLANWMAWAAGVLLNEVVFYTVVKMSDNLTKIGSINTAWQVIRDVANMAFIFVLLYAAIQTILGIGKDTQKIIVRVVVVAILINFSLFFTKVVIDISNVLALTLYDAIAPGVIASGETDSGIADQLTASLQLGSILQNVGALDPGKLMVVGIIGSVFSMLVAFTLLSVSVMFIMRFVVLIFVLVLSPIAFIAFILPQAEPYQKQWKDALIGQAFFAPIFFLLIWVVVLISRGLFTTQESLAGAILGRVGANGAAQAGDIAPIMNFLIMIAMIMTALTVAKEWSGKAGPASSKLTNWLVGGAGALTLGAAGRFGRGTIGRAGAGLASSETVKNMIGKGGAAGLAGRMAMAAGQKTAKASWDMRGSGIIDKKLSAGKPQKGGFMADEKARQKFAAERAKALQPNEIEKQRLQNIEDQALARYGYSKPLPLTQAEEFEKASRQRRKGENDEAYKNRRKQAEDRLKREEEADRAIREVKAQEAKAVGDESVLKAMTANKVAKTRSENYAVRAGTPTVKMPTLPGGARFEAIKKINEKVERANEAVFNKGIGGTAGEYLREVAQNRKIEGKRGGGFLDAVGKILALRQAERLTRTQKARDYETTLSKMKSEELAEKVKKTLEQEEKEPEAPKSEEGEAKPS